MLFYKLKFIVRGLEIILNEFLGEILEKIFRNKEVLKDKCVVYLCMKIFKY